jgi:hypothetical protein
VLDEPSLLGGGAARTRVSSAGQSNPSPAYGPVATASMGGPPGWSRASAAVRALTPAMQDEGVVANRAQRVGELVQVLCGPVGEDEAVPALGQRNHHVGDDLPGWLLVGEISQVKVSTLSGEPRRLGQTPEWRRGLFRVTFPSDFYVVGATVIPVLFLAVAVQGGAYETMIRAGVRYSLSFFRKTGFRSYATGAGGGILMAAAVAGIIFYAVAGEIVALNALKSESDTPLDRRHVMVSTTSLLIAAIIPPVLTWIRAFAEILKEGYRSERRRRASTSGQQPEERGLPWRQHYG